MSQTTQKSCSVSDQSCASISLRLFRAFRGSIKTDTSYAGFIENPNAWLRWTKPMRVIRNKTVRMPHGLCACKVNSCRSDTEKNTLRLYAEALEFSRGVHSHLHIHTRCFASKLSRRICTNNFCSVSHPLHCKGFCAAVKVTHCEGIRQFRNLSFARKSIRAS